MRKIVLLAAIAATSMFTAPKVGAQQIRASAGSYTLEVGDTLPLEMNNRRRGVTWSSSDSSIVTLSSSTREITAFALKPGVALIWGVYGRRDHSDTITVTVSGDTMPDTLPTDPEPTEAVIDFIGEDTTGVGSVFTLQFTPGNRADTSEIKLDSSGDPTWVSGFDSVYYELPGEANARTTGNQVSFWMPSGPGRIRIRSHPLPGGDSPTQTDTSFTVAADAVVVPPDTASPPDTSTNPGDSITPPPVLPPGAAPELPRAYVDVTEPVTTQDVHVAPGGLQAAVNVAVGGQRLLLAPGGRYGAVSLPANGGAPIVIQTDVSLPSGRMTAAISSQLNLAVVEGGALNVPVIQCNSCSGWRIQGVEVRVAPGVVDLGELITIRPFPDPTAQSSDVILDRIYAHGEAADGLQLKRCVGIHGVNVAVANSSLLDCTKLGQDSQAIWTAVGPGPLGIYNNHLQAGSEVIISGGGDPATPGLVPSDIHIAGNWLHRPQEWKIDPSDSTDVHVGDVKNLFELKNAQRVLFENNVLENNWAHGQSGWSILFKSTNQYGGCTWCQTSDITVRWNLLDNGQNGFQVMRFASNTYSGGQTHNILAHDNVFARLGPNGDNGTGEGHTGSALYFTGEPDGVTVRNNTFENRDGTHWSISIDTGGWAESSVNRNVGWHGLYGQWEASETSRYPEQGNVVIPQGQDAPDTRTITLAGRVYTLPWYPGAGANLVELSVRLGGVR